MAFHPYPQVIPSVFNLSGFGPPQGLTPASACPWIAHPASRLRRATSSPCSDSLSLRLGIPLTSPRTATRRLILQKARRHPAKGAPTACRRTVSGTVSLPSRGAFHLSLTVLVRYRSSESVQPWRVVPPASRRISRVRRYSGAASRGGRGFAYGAFTLFRRPFHAVPLPRPFVTAPQVSGPCAVRPHNPHAATPLRYTHARVWAGPLSLAATRGISVDFSSSGYLDVSVPRVVASRRMCSGGGAWA